MLAALGPCAFTLKTNLQAISYSWSTSFATHDVIGAGPVYEDMGDGEATIEIEGVIFTQAIGVDGGFHKMMSARAGRVPVPFMLRDLRPLGWVLIDSLKRSDSDLGLTGNGNKIDFNASLIRVGTPSGGILTSVLRLL